MSKKTKEVPQDKPEAVKPKPPKKGERQLSVKFTEAELLVIARKLAETNAELARAENDKKAVTSQLKAKCDRIAAEIGELSSKITSGFEYRNVQILTTFDDPKPLWKTTVRLDTDEVIECEQMSLTELQADLPLGGNITIKLGSNGKVSTPDLVRRTVSASGVVATDEDGKGEDLQDDDAEGV